MHDTIIIEALYISPGHDYFGRHGKEPEDYVIIAAPSIQCVAGKGIVGDRFYDFKPDYAGQITFFAIEVHEALLEKVFPQVHEPSAYRRNVITRGVDLNAWIGQTFRIGDCVFQGITECKPCYWMDRACGEGSEEFLKGQGGLRAKILTGGELHVGAVAWSLVSL